MSTWKEISEGNFPIFPTGTYKVKITNVKVKTSPKKGTPGIQFTGAILSPEEHVGRSMVTDAWKGGDWKAVRIVEACGLAGVPDNLTVDVDNPAFFEVCRSIIGCTTFWRNEQSQFEGKPKNDIVDFQSDPEQAITEFVTDDGAPDFVK